MESKTEEKTESVTEPHKESGTESEIEPHKESGTKQDTSPKEENILGINQNTLNTSAAELVMKLAQELVDNLIMPYQLVINEQAKLFDDKSILSCNTDYIKTQAEMRMALIKLISAENTEFLNSLKEMFAQIGSTAFGLADKTFPVAVVVQLTDMIRNIVGIGKKMNNKLEKITSELDASPPDLHLPSVYPPDLHLPSVQKPEVHLSTVQKPEVHLSSTNTVNPSTASPPTVSPSTASPSTVSPSTASVSSKGGGINHKKKHIQSLKKKYLCNQKTLKIKNRLHKLLMK